MRKIDALILIKEIDALILIKEGAERVNNESLVSQCEQQLAKRGCVIHADYVNRGDNA